MKIEYEVSKNNKKFIRELAKQDMRFEKSKTAISVFTIGLSVAFILAVILVLLGTAEKHKLTQAGKAQITMAITDTEQIKKLQEQPETEWIGISAALGFSYQDGITLNVLYEDKQQIEKQERIKYIGEIPSKENEVMLPFQYSSVLDKEIKIGDYVNLDITGTGVSEKYIVSGIADIKHLEKDFFVWVSEKKAEELYRDSLVPRTAYIRMNTDSYDMNILNNMGMNLSEKAGIIKESVSPIMDYCVVMSGGDMGGIYTTIFPVAIVVFVLASIIVYSIFYASVMKNVRGFGRLCTIGMSKKQIRQMVKFERNIYSICGILSGIILGGLISFIVNVEGFTIKNFLTASIIITILMFLVIKIALHKPIKIASTISPIEGSKWINASGNNYVSRKIGNKLTAIRVGIINLRRNLKKTILTIFILSFGGILLVMVSTVAESLSSRKMAEFYMFPYGDIQIRIQSLGKTTFDENIQQDRISNLQRTKNPLNKSLTSTLKNIHGVKKINTENAINLSIQYQDGTLATSGGTGGLTSVLSEEQCGILSQAVIEGSSDYGELSKKNGILLRNGTADLHVGDTVLLEGTDESGNEFKTEVPVLGIYDQNLQQEICPLSSESDFMVVDNTAHKLTGIEELTGIITVDYARNQEDNIKSQIEYFCNQSDQIEMYGIEESIKTRSEIFDTKTEPLYLISLILFIFGIISLVNTSLTNLIVRKREFALLEAIGMTGKQIRKVVLTEELAYFIISTLLTLVLGNIGGILMCNYLEKTSHCVELNLPFTISIIYIVSLVLVELIIIWRSFAKMKEESIVESISIQE